MFGRVRMSGFYTHFDHHKLQRVGSALGPYCNCSRFQLLMAMAIQGRDSENAKKKLRQGHLEKLLD